MNNKTKEFLEKWHRIVLEKDMDMLREIVADDVTLYSPVVFKPKKSKDETLFVLSNVIQVFENFAYHREFADGNNLALEFSANIGEKSCKGIDLIEINDSGKLVNIEVFIRPVQGLLALGEAMNKRFEEAGIPVGKKLPSA